MKQHFYDDVPSAATGVLATTMLARQIVTNTTSTSQPPSLPPLPPLQEQPVEENDNNNGNNDDENDDVMKLNDLLHITAATVTANVIATLLENSAALERA